MWRLKRWLYRGLTVLRWLLFPVLMIALLLGMCVPAAADGYFSYSGNLYDLPDFSYITGDDVLSGTLTDGTYTWGIPSNQLSQAVGWNIPFSFSCSPGDQFSMSTQFYGWSWIGFNIMDVYLVTADGKYHLIDTFSNTVDGATSGGNFFNFFVDINKALSFGGSVTEIRFDLFISHFTSAIFNVLNNPFTLRCGDPNSPNAPAYSSPEGGSVSDLGSAESSLMNGAQDGIDKAGESFSGLDNNLAGYMNGLLMCSKIMGAAIVKLPWLGTVIEISLALGLFAALLGLGAALIGASDRRAAASARSDRAWERTQSRYGPRFIRRRHK